MLREAKKRGEQVSKANEIVAYFDLLFYIKIPVHSKSLHPTNEPYLQPSLQPRNQASKQATKQPTNQPTNQPTDQQSAANAEDADGGLVSTAPAPELLA